MTATVGTLPPGSIGFDCNTRVTGVVAKLFYDAGYRFCVRYVRRSTTHNYDLSASEILTLLNAGLAVSVVQHVAAENWLPTGSLGTAYGAIAANEAHMIGVPRKVVIWCDLEGVKPGTPASDTIAFCNAWFDAVMAGGYDPGIYIGWHSGLTASEMYYKLKFRRYWSGYNLNKDQVPAVRGVCMAQGEYPKPADRVHGVPFEYDVDEIKLDGFNNLPAMLLPDCPP